MRRIIVSKLLAFVVGLPLVLCSGGYQLGLAEQPVDLLTSPQTSQDEVQTRGTLTPALTAPQPVLPPTLSVSTPATCPSGYTVNGHFISKAAFQATLAPAAKPQASSNTPNIGTPIPSIPSPTPIIAATPVISGIAWNFDANQLEIQGTNFTQFYCPSPNFNCVNTTPHLLVNGSASLSAPFGASAILTSQIRQSGCYTFVVQRSVAVSAGGNLLKEAPGPMSVPYQEFVFVPKRVRLDGVQPLLATLDQPLGYQLIGKVQNLNDSWQGLGKATDLQVWAIAASNQHLADGSQGRLIPPDHIQVANDNAIIVRDEFVQGDTIHFVKIQDAHYGAIQSNNVPATLPRRLVIQQIAPFGTGYVITGPNFGTDLTQLRVIENNTLVPQQNISLNVLTGISSNTTQLVVAHSPASGLTTVSVYTLVPGLGQSRPVTVTLPPHQ